MNIIFLNRMSTFLLIMLLLSLCACHSAELDPQGELKLITRPQSAHEVKAPGLNFTKSDQTGDAELVSELAFGEVFQLESALAQVIPIPLQEGDHSSISVWSNQASVLMIYRPSTIDGLWQMEEQRLLSDWYKEGLESVTLDFKATQTGRYALVIVPTAGVTQHLITTQCNQGPCRSQLLSEAQRLLNEEQEATVRPLELP